jgi:hypothetical protein
MYKYIETGMDDQIPCSVQGDYRMFTWKTEDSYEIHKSDNQMQNSIQQPTGSDVIWFLLHNRTHITLVAKSFFTNRVFYKARHISTLRYVWRCFHSNGYSIRVTWSHACPLRYLEKNQRSGNSAGYLPCSRASPHYVTYGALTAGRAQWLTYLAHAHVYTLRHICRRSTPIVIQLINLPRGWLQKSKPDHRSQLCVNWNL